MRSAIYGALCGFVAAILVGVLVLQHLGALTVRTKPLIITPILVDKSPTPKRPTSTPTPFRHQNADPWPPENSPPIETAPGVVVAQAPFVDGIARVEHECCDCGLVHHVLFWVIDLGGDRFALGMRWERDDKETRKRRLHKFGSGWDRDPMSPRER